jgi:MFS family permease
VYGGNVLLAGTFTGNVRVVASDHVTLAEGTVIHGSFDYNAPQEADIPASAAVDGGTHYVGSASFLPTAEEARTFAIAGLGIFFLVRLVAAILAAGLVAGLFPEYAHRITEEAFGHSIKRFIIITLLGFAVIIATPVLLLLLVISFVGIGIAALLGALYILLLMLAYLYAGVLVGSAFMRTLMKREDVTWKGTVLGMTILGLIGLAPVFGTLVVFVLSSAALGAMVIVFYTFAFGRGEHV